MKRVPVSGVSLPSVRGRLDLENLIRFDSPHAILRAVTLSYGSRLRILRHTYDLNSALFCPSDECSRLQDITLFTLVRGKNKNGDPQRPRRKLGNNDDGRTTSMHGILNAS